MFKRSAVFVMIAALIFLVLGCNADAITAADQEAGLAYTDPKIDMAVYLEGKNWTYEKDKNGQVYFSLKNDALKNNVISISSQPIQGDAGATLETIWGMMKKQLEGVAQTDNTYKDIRAGKYAGKALFFSVDDQNGSITGGYYLWSTDDKVYICSATEDKDGKTTVEAAINSILQSFRTYNELKQELGDKQ